ncbi:hypothetical protein [Paenibacillus dokdonensis]
MALVQQIVDHVHIPVLARRLLLLVVQLRHQTVERFGPAGH